MSYIAELEDLRNKAMSKRVNIIFEIKAIEEKLQILKQEAFVPDWFVQRSWDEVNE